MVRCLNKGSKKINLACHSFQQERNFSSFQAVLGHTEQTKLANDNKNKPCSKGVIVLTKFLLMFFGV